MKSILVIEDDPSIRESILDFLTVADYLSIGAETGELGLAIAEQQLPDLILCDIHLPGQDGYSVLESLRQQPATALTPFIFLTAMDTRQHIRRGMDLGADDYLVKPCRANELINAIHTRLDRQQTLVRCARAETSRFAPNPSSGQQRSLSQRGLLEHFHQELRNPLSNINMVLHLLRQPLADSEFRRRLATVQQSYPRELAVLTQVSQLKSLLTSESIELLQQCHLLQGNSYEKSSRY